MNKSQEYEVRTEELLSPIMEEHSFELVDVEYVKEGSSKFLRAYIDKPGGITIDDCEIVSRELEEKLDQADFIDEAYILEISSPGLGRPLKKDKDFERSIGSEVEIHLYKPADFGRELNGILQSYDGKSVTVLADGEEITLERSAIALIRLAFDF